MQTFNTRFTLSREYLAECFDQSLPYGKNARPNYLFPALLFGTGSGLLFFTDQPTIAGVMLIALCAVELLHMRFRRAWWLARQMWGRSANSEVLLTIDEEGVKTQNPYTETSCAGQISNVSLKPTQGLFWWQNPAPSNTCPNHCSQRR